jgi:hypothetical protein
MDGLKALMPSRLLAAGLVMSAMASAAPASACVLLDTFDNLNPFVRQDGYHQFSYKPAIGPNAVVRYWHPGIWGGGAPGPSYVSFDPVGGRSGGAAVFNYSGSDNGYTTQDEIAYPIGGLVSTRQGTIQFDYKPLYSSNDDSAVMYLLTTKPRINTPNATYTESLRNGIANLQLAYLGWGGRKNFWVNVFDNGSDPAIQIQSPGEGQANQFRFAANKWMRMALTWNSEGIPAYGNKTIVLFINGIELVSTTQKFTARSLDRYLILGAQDGCIFVQNSPAKCYSGASGSFDNLRVERVSRTTFGKASTAALAAPNAR